MLMTPSVTREIIQSHLFTSCKPEFPRGGTAVSASLGVVAAQIHTAAEVPPSLLRAYFLNLNLLVFILVFILI